MNEDIRELLTRGASDAADTDLVAGVWQRAQRHRRNRNLGIASLAAAGVAVTFALTQIGGTDDDELRPADNTATRTAPTTPDTPALPEGWRWESFGGVQVGVPGDWEWGVTPRGLSQWCHLENPEGPRSMVTRASDHMTLMECPGNELPPGTFSNTKDLVVFNWSAFPDRKPDVRSERTNLQMNGVSVVVQGSEALREQIVGTVHVVDDDAKGCPATHSVTTDPAWRPSGPAVNALTDVSSVSVCRYTLRDVTPDNPNVSSSSMISSLYLEGSDAQDAVLTLAKAPLGFGPNSPESCDSNRAFGSEAIILQLTSASETAEVVVRYSGCDHHGFDDGHDVRTLTAEAIAPFIAGPNLPQTASSEVADILYPRDIQE